MKKSKDKSTYVQHDCKNPLLRQTELCHQASIFFLRISLAKLLRAIFFNYLFIYIQSFQMLFLLIFFSFLYTNFFLGQSFKIQIFMQYIFINSYGHVYDSQSKQGIILHISPIVYGPISESSLLMIYSDQSQHIRRQLVSW